MEKVSNKLIGVTGANGFIASHIVQQLLDKGYKVRGTVRNLKKKEKYEHLLKFKNAKENLELVEANLLNKESAVNACKGLTDLLHTASPYTMNVKDPQKDLVDPAVKGTTNFLEAAAETGTVKKIIVTSSLAAITDQPESDHVYTEKDWNKLSSLKRNPYYYSKTLAEKAAWKFHEEHKDIELIVINPFLVIGPSYTGRTINESNKIIQGILNKQFPGILDLSWGLVDVRDVAKSHVLAMEKDTACGRNLVAAHPINMTKVVEIIKKKYPQYPTPGMNLASCTGNTVIKLFSYFQPGNVGTYLRTNIGRKFNFDNSKVKKDLGIEFIEAEKTVLDTVEDLIEWGHLPDLRKKEISQEQQQQAKQSIKENVKPAKQAKVDGKDVDVFASNDLVTWSRDFFKLRADTVAISYLNALISKNCIASTQKSDKFNKKHFYYVL